MRVWVVLVAILAGCQSTPPAEKTAEENQLPVFGRWKAEDSVRLRAGAEQPSPIERELEILPGSVVVTQRCAIPSGKSLSASLKTNALVDEETIHFFEDGTSTAQSEVARPEKKTDSARFHWTCTAKVRRGSLRYRIELGNLFLHEPDGSVVQFRRLPRVEPGPG